MKAPEEVALGTPEDVGLEAPEEDTAEAPDEASMGQAGRSILIAASVGAGAIHIWAALKHAHPELIRFLVFFLVVAAFQMWWAAALLWIRRLPRSVLIAGPVVNAVVVVVWLLSRTTNLPLITRTEQNMDDVFTGAVTSGGSPLAPMRGFSGHPEAFGLLDTAASAFEIVVIVGVVLVLLRMRRRPAEAVPGDETDQPGALA